MIIDLHVHLGYDEVFGSDFALEPLERFISAESAEYSGEYGDVVCIVQPATCVFYEPVQQQHDAVARLVAAHPGRAYGMANPNPHLPDDLYGQELVRCVRELGFVGVKIQTLGHAVGINSRAAQKVYRWAEELGIPVMIHTGAGNAFSSALGAIPVAQAHPRVRLVLAHAGSSGTGPEALAAAQACENIYLETTWAPYSFLNQAIAALGPGRIVFGSDHIANFEVELAKFRTLKLSAADLEMCLSGTARQVFKVPEVHR